MSKQLKLAYITAIIQTGITHDICPLKPFNPTWGETLNAQIGDIECYLEKTLHKPPVVSF